MNVRNRRGIENLLLRRVRRHQSMTALFRAPDMDAVRPRPTQARPVVQKQELPVDVPAAEAIPSLPVIPVRSDTATRKVVASSPPIPLPPTPSPSAPLASEPAKTPDPAWKRLQTIFRKHEEQHDSSVMDATDMEASTVESVQKKAYEEKEQSRTTSTEKHTLPTHNQDVALPATRHVQRSSENVAPNSEFMSSNIQRKVQSLPPASPEIKRPETIHNVEPTSTLLDKKTDTNDQASIASEPEGPSLPLESVWNVQRVEAPHPLFQENIPHPILDSTDVDKNETSIEPSPVHEQKPASGPVQLRREDDSPNKTQISDSLPVSEQREESREPVEILSPSRPRPPQMDIPPGNTSIQRQSLDGHTSKEVNDAPPVNTAIGPLPADLWWLLGQKPPAAAPASQPEVQRTIQRDQKQVPSEQRKVVPPTEQSVETPVMPNIIQRQVLSSALPSSPQEPANPAPAEEPKHAEPDLDDLVRRVYAEVRRRLAAEWERRR